MKFYVWILVVEVLYVMIGFLHFLLNILYGILVVEIFCESGC